MRVAMVGARFAGLDGVTLEAAKLAEALRRGGHQVAWFGGDIGSSFDPASVFGPASFHTETNVGIQARAFNGGDEASVRNEIAKTASEIRPALEHFLSIHGVDVVVVENAWAIPMQLPLAVAIADAVERTGIPAVGHHHDFAWERERFDHCVVPDLVDRYFPPDLEGVAHIVINSLARIDLIERRGLNSLVLPNVMDFETGRPVARDDGVGFRRIAGLDPSDTVLLQPTRVIPRKGIELTIELAAAMAGEPKIVITHPDDLDLAYWRMLTDMANELRVDLRIVDVGRDLASLTSAYEAADLVCFPSLYEGYGNALVESVYHSRPLLVNRYPVYASDIAPLGFEFIEIEGAITDEAVAHADAVVANRDVMASVVESNYAIGRSHLSYSKALTVLEEAMALI